MNKTSKIILAILVLVIIVVLIAIFYKPAPKGTIKIGAILPLSGKNISYGERTQKGIELALEEVNKEKEAIAIIYEDSKGDSTTGVNAANKLINIDKVSILLVQLSEISEAVAPIAQENKTLLFGFTLTPDFTKTGDYIFRNRGDAIEEGKLMGKFTLNKGYKRVAVLYKNNSTGIGEAEGFKEVFEKEGGDIGFFESYNVGETDFKTMLLKIKETNPEIIVCPSRDKDLPLILRQAKELGLNQQFFSTQGIATKGLLEAAGSLAEGLLYAESVIYEESADPYVQAALKAYKQKYNENMDLYAGDAYDVIKVLGYVIKGGAATKEEIKEALMKIKDFPGVSGSITFNEFRDVPKEYRIFTVKNGQFVPYEE